MSAPLPLPEPTDVEIDGAVIATRVLEPTATPVGDVVLCHGTPWSSRVWSRVAHDLSRGYRVFLWDMPGYGQSTKDPAVLVDLRSQMKRLTELLAQWDVDRPHMVAHDVGGAVALGAHLLHGVEYRDVFLWDIVTLDPWGSSFFRLVADNPQVFAALPPALHAALVTEYIAGAVNHNLPASDVAALAQPWLDAVGQAAFYRQIASLSPADTRPVAQHLGEMRCPVRIGWGSRDPWIPVQQAYELQAALPGTPSVIELDDVGHLAPVESSSAVSQALRDWFSDGSQ
ncbi:alpha/beta hydrolase [Gordonia sp. CPCC 206044]|uniref:alpha/beta fold hydrolase n=1 Tax=Gordonia sp. CPCC 206044 TaxID=3140793 RepID=UPI003AF4091F